MTKTASSVSKDGRSATNAGNESAREDGDRAQDVASSSQLLPSPLLDDLTTSNIEFKRHHKSFQELSLLIRLSSSFYLMITAEQ